MNKPPRIVLWIALAAVVISLVYAFFWHDRPRVDAQAYDKIGWNLARGLGYVEEEENALTPEQDWAIIRVGPGYQFFLAGVYWVFGHTIWMVWILHALLRGLSVILVWYIARELFPASSRAGIAAAVLFAFAPDLVVVSGLLLTETVFIALFLGAMLASFRYLDTRHPLLLVLLAVLWACAILVRPTALLPAVALLGLFAWRRDMRAVLIMLVISLALIGPWSYIASQRYDRFILTTGVGGYDLWVGNHPGAQGGFEKSPEIQHVRETVSFHELDRISKEAYWAFLLNHPGEFMFLQIKKAALYFSLIRPTGFWIHLSDYPYQRLATLVASGIWTALLLVGGVAGFFVLAREALRNEKILLLLLFALSQPLSVIPVIVETRYRFVLYPLLAFLAGAWVARGKKRWALAVSAALLVTFTAIDMVSHASSIMRRIMDAFTF